MQPSSLPVKKNYEMDFLIDHSNFIGVFLFLSEGNQNCRSANVAGCSGKKQ